jgi:hypothetical protein
VIQNQNRTAAAIIVVIVMVIAGIMLMPGQL